MAEKRRKNQGNTGTRSRKSSSGNSRSQNEEIKTGEDGALIKEAGMLLIFAFSVILFIGNFGLTGGFGRVVNTFLFGLFGFTQYLFPVVLCVQVWFFLANQNNPHATVRLALSAVLFTDLGMLFQLFFNREYEREKYESYYTFGAETHHGGGLLGGGFFGLLKKGLGTTGLVILILVLAIICLVLITGKSFFGGVKKGSRKVADTAKLTRERYLEERARREEEREKAFSAQETYEDDALRDRLVSVDLKKAAEGEKPLSERIEEAALSEVMPEEAAETAEKPEKVPVFKLHHSHGAAPAENVLTEKVVRMPGEISISEVDFASEARDIFDLEKVAPETYEEELLPAEESEKPVPAEEPFEPAYAEELYEPVPEPYAPVSAQEMNSDELPETVPDLSELVSPEVPPEEEAGYLDEDDFEGTGEFVRPGESTDKGSDDGEEIDENTDDENLIGEEIEAFDEEEAEKEYVLPPASLLTKGKEESGDSEEKLKETAEKLTDTLASFGVNVTLTDFSRGPTVTRYEIQPEQGVKVNRILSLSDDIKLNLAAADIRIEAPIPGKAAVGIEVPNRTNTPVMLRDLIDSAEFAAAKSKLTFAVGKDIAGKPVVFDIDKMPHLLIAGATGSGKSVCINTIIMSLLFKARPDEVKMIMVDPKVVELSVYNGLPHLLTPVVTDPQKAAGALHWGLAEMQRRYRLFADERVRDIVGYNDKISRVYPDEKPLPRIVIIVDELADLMMVAKSEVEISICRLAQLARAAGIHLVIATQRPSVDVITGLIKANMPSRIAFAVSSGVDSRTILDMYGAEKLLGKGDMLFYPQGHTKPERLQGAFVSDSEVESVVNFILEHTPSAGADGDAEDISSEIEEHASAGHSSALSQTPSAELSEDDGRDQYFADAGRFIIEKQKASIGNLQRNFRIGFNRAARIMDQLSDAGVVSHEDGTKARQILMDMDEFNALLNGVRQEEEDQ
ncbi:MAG: DNA translocase FtsK [Lachnospiraceae bacterium]|nr:DNA translocase FtsK [Lachnospiraceae bacterium]